MLFRQQVLEVLCDRLRFEFKLELFDRLLSPGATLNAVVLEHFCSEKSFWQRHRIFTLRVSLASDEHLACRFDRLDTHHGAATLWTLHE